MKTMYNLFSISAKFSAGVPEGPSGNKLQRSVQISGKFEAIRQVIDLKTNRLQSVQISLPSLSSARLVNHSIALLKK